MLKTLTKYHKESINISWNFAPYNTVQSLHIKGAFFWDYSGIGILGIDGICVLLVAISFSGFRNERNIIPFILLPIAEWTEWKECGLLGIYRIRVILGTFGREILHGRPHRSRPVDIVVLRSPPIPFRFPDPKHVGAFFSELKFRVFCYS